MSRHDRWFIWRTWKFDAVKQGVFDMTVCAWLVHAYADYDKLDWLNNPPRFVEVPQTVYDELQARHDDGRMGWECFDEFSFDGGLMFRNIRLRCEEVYVPTEEERTRNVSGKWPLDCVALACHPNQVEAMNERNRKHGINVRYDPKTGNAQISDEGNYRRLRRLEGVHHKDGYYG